VRGTGHSQTGDRRGRNKLRHQKEVIKQGEFTPWGWQREGQVRTWKESDQARDTHSLETAEGGTSQDIKGKQLNKGALTNWRPAEGGTSQDTERK